MQAKPDWTQGEKYLRENAPELISFLEKYGPCTLVPDDKDIYFRVLLTGIAAQQLPPETSLAIMERLKELTGEPMLPEKVLELTDQQLVDCGLTEVKAGYMKDFARALVDGTIDLDAFDEMEDSRIVKTLKTVKGLGQWTVELFLMLSLCRQDVVPGDDFLLKREIQQLYGLDKLPKRGQVIRLTEKWRPWRSLGVWCLLKHSEEVEVKNG